jgi:hypothetical protein
MWRFFSLIFHRARLFCLLFLAMKKSKAARRAQKPEKHQRLFIVPLYPTVRPAPKITTFHF